MVAPECISTLACLCVRCHVSHYQNKSFLLLLLAGYALVWCENYDMFLYNRSGILRNGDFSIEERTRYCLSGRMSYSIKSITNSILFQRIGDAEILSHKYLSFTIFISASCYRFPDTFLISHICYNIRLMRKHFV